MTQNPNWPRMDVSVAFGSGPLHQVGPFWMSVTGRTRGQITTQRGRQYELDQVQTGTWAGQLDNRDCYLDPGNSASPAYPNVVPYRDFRHRAQWPATNNILTPDVATAFYSSKGAAGAGSTLPAGVATSALAGSSLSIVTLDSQVNAYSASIPAVALGGGAIMGFYDYPTNPGDTLSFSIQVTGSASAVQAQIAWINSDGSTILLKTTGAPVTPGTTAVTMSATSTAPANALGCLITIIPAVTTTGTTSYQLSRPQVEYAPAPSTWGTPGKWYPLFRGFVERWPQQWEMNGLYGQSALVAVDAFGYLSQSRILSCFYQEVLANSPSWFYPLDESSAAVSYTDLTGTHPPVKKVTYLSGASQTFGPGNSLTSRIQPPLGITGPVFSSTPPLPAQRDGGGVALDMTARGAVGPPTNSGWTRIIACRVQYPLPTYSGFYRSDLWSISDLNATNVIAFGPSQTSSSPGQPMQFWGEALGVVKNGVTVLDLECEGTTYLLSDGDWHFFAVTCSADGRTWTIYRDGSQVGTQTLASDGRPAFTSKGCGDIVGGLINPVSGSGPLQQQWNGDFCCVAEFPSDIGAYAIYKLYSVFQWASRNYGTDSSFNRYQDILYWANWSGNQAVDNYTTGQTQAYGPATEMGATASSSGSDVVSMLQTVVDTEAGFHYVAADGTITFKARRARYNQTSPVVVFGENTAAGEVPYLANIKTGYDPTRLANDISTVQTQTSVSTRSVDNNSAQNYGDIQLQRTLNTLNPLEQQDAADYLRTRNSLPVQRVEGITVDVGANPAKLWPVMLPLELGTRVRVMRRPPLGGATIQIDGFIEQLNWTFDDKGNAAVDLQISVNNQQQFWQLDSASFSKLDSTTILGY